MDGVPWRGRNLLDICEFQAYRENKQTIGSWWRRIALSSSEHEASQRRTGTPLDMTSITYCPKCGFGMKPSDRFCAACGYDRGSQEVRQESVEVVANRQPSPKSSNNQTSILTLGGFAIALLVGILFGYLLTEVFDETGWDSPTANVFSFATGILLVVLVTAAYQYLKIIEATRRDFQEFLDRQKPEVE
jgi:ribosomal protein L32